MRSTKRPQNFCRDCGYRWAPRGHGVSRACPNCGGPNVDVPKGCLRYVWGALAGLVLVIWAANHSSEVLGLLVVGGVGWGAVVIARQIHARNALALAASEQDRMLSAAAAETERRRVRLIEEFGEDGAGNILAGRLWVGAPFAAVREMLGEPAEVGERVKGGRTTHVLKYRGSDGNVAFKIVVEDGLVSGWERGSL